MGLEKIDKYDENVIAAVGAYGGGIATTGAVCGTLLGAVAVVSALHSRGNLAEEENPRMWRASKQLIAHFDHLTAPYGGSNCIDITGMDWSDREAIAKFRNDPNSTRKHCRRLIGELTHKLGKILEHELALLNNT